MRGMLDDLHLVDVARAVRKDARRRDADDEHGPGILRAKRIVRDDLRRSVHTQPFRSFEIEKQQPDVRIHQHVAPRAVHPVAVVIRHGQCVLVQHMHEPGQAAFVRTVRTPLRIRRGDEEHRASLNERAVFIRERGAHDHLLQAVRE
jgi:hypothetical protein